MKRKSLFTALLLLVTAALSNAAEKPDTKSETPTAATNAPSVQVIAYYFHGTLRCMECLKIERQARDIIEDTFKAEMAAKRVVFKPLNYDLPENAHFSVDYKLPCPSLVIVRRNSGKAEKWKLLEETWQLVGDTAKFNSYVTNEVAKLLTASVPAPSQ
jgi:hypothetical protein